MLTSVFAVVIFRAAFKTLVILAPLLGVTWLLGFISIHSKSLVFQYLFAVVNSFQVTVTQLIKLCTKSKSWVGVGVGGRGEGGGDYYGKCLLQDRNFWLFDVSMYFTETVPSITEKWYSFHLKDK